MQIKRIEGYSNHTFKRDILRQRGAFMVEGRYPCSFKIISPNSATVSYHDMSALPELIKKFRYYAEHITDFYDENMHLLYSLPPVSKRKTDILSLAPTQFFIDWEKLDAVKSFVSSSEDVIIPVAHWGDRLIILDGHTRLYAAHGLGIKEAYIFESSDAADQSYLAIAHRFASLADERGINSIADMKVISHSDYVLRWHSFCKSVLEKPSQGTPSVAYASLDGRSRLCSLLHLMDEGS